MQFNNNRSLTRAALLQAEGYRAARVSKRSSNNNIPRYDGLMVSRRWESNFPLMVFAGSQDLEFFLTGAVAVEVWLSDLSK